MLRPALVFSQMQPAPNTSRTDGYQSFGRVSVDANSRVMTVRQRDIDARALFAGAQRPAHASRARVDAPDDVLA